MAPTPPARLRFSRAQRLKQGRDFSRARTNGQRLVSGCLIANWLKLSGGGPARLGVVTSRRIGNAAIRSRARRLLRETFRVHQHDFEWPVDLVLVARPSIAGKRFIEVEQDFLSALRRAKLLKETM